MPNKWYCVQAHHGKAKIARSALERLGYKVYMPTQLAVNQKNRKYELQLSMGNYFFALFDTKNNSWCQILHTPEVKSVLGAKYNPTPVPNSQIRSMMARDAVHSGEIKKGSLVRVIRGKHAGWIGLCEFSDAKFVAILVIDEEPFNYTFDRSNVMLTKWVPYAES